MIILIKFDFLLFGSFRLYCIYFLFIYVLLFFIIILLSMVIQHGDIARLL